MHRNARSSRGRPAAAALLALLTLAPLSEVAAACARRSAPVAVDVARIELAACTNPGRIRTIPSAAIRACDFDAIVEVMQHNDAVADYYWCRVEESMGRTLAAMDATTGKVFVATWEGAKASLQGAAAALKGPAGGPMATKAVASAIDAAEAYAEAGVAAIEFMEASDINDENFRLYANALHQVGLAETLLRQMEENCHD